MSATMAAAVFRAGASRLSVEEVSIDAPGPQEVLVRTAATGLCHSDLHFIDGSWPIPTPCVLGHEAAGVVEAVGGEVQEFSPGDHVVTCLSVGCGECNICLGGRSYLCADGRALRTRPAGQSPRLAIDGRELHQFVGLATFAERMLVHRRALVRIRPDMPLDRAALLGCGVLTGTGAVFRTAGFVGGGCGVRRCRHGSRPGGPHRRCHHRDRCGHRAPQAGVGEGTRCHAHRRSRRRGSRRAGAVTHRRRSRVHVRGDRFAAHG